MAVSTKALLCLIPAFICQASFAQQMRIQEPPPPPPRSSAGAKPAESVAEQKPESKFSDSQASPKEPSSIYFNPANALRTPQAATSPGAAYPVDQQALAAGAEDLSLEMAAYQLNLIYNHCSAKDRFFKQRYENSMTAARVISAMTAVTPDFEVLAVESMTEEHLYAPAVAALRKKYKTDALNYKNSLELNFSDTSFCSRMESNFAYTNQVVTSRFEAQQLSNKAVKLINKVKAYPAFAKTDFSSLRLRTY